MKKLLLVRSGQAMLLTLAVLAVVVVGALMLGAVARGIGKGGENQTAADLAALAGAKKMLELYPRLFEPVMINDRINPNRITATAYMNAARTRAVEVAKKNGASSISIKFPDFKTGAPMRIEVVVDDPTVVEIAGSRKKKAILQEAEAELRPLANPEMYGPTGAQGEYQGPFEYRQGKPMRPDVAKAFDRMYEAARKEAGITLIITSAYRGYAEQKALFDANPDPQMVAPPGESLHRLGTELDIGPASVYGWLASNSERFGFLKRYSWEPWHFGYTRNAGSSSVGYGGSSKGSGNGDGERGYPSVPAFVPERYRPMISKSAQRWNVSAALLAAQIYQESRFNPNARSPLGALGIAQFMPATAQEYGLDNPLDPEQSIDAQGHFMHDLLRMFGSVPLALAAYNAGPGAVKSCGCTDPFAETRNYVASILALMNGNGDINFVGGGSGLEVRLVK